MGKFTDSEKFASALQKSKIKKNPFVFSGHPGTHLPKPRDVYKIYLLKISDTVFGTFRVYKALVRH